MEKHIKTLAVVFVMAIAFGAALAWACAPDSDGAIEEKQVMNFDGDLSGIMLNDSNQAIAYGGAYVTRGTDKTTFYMKTGFMIDNSKWDGCYWVMREVKNGNTSNPGYGYVPMSSSGNGNFADALYTAVDGDYYTFSFRLCKSMNWDKMASGTSEFSITFSIYATTQYVYTTDISYDINYGTNAPAATKDTRTSESVLGTIEMTVSDSTSMSREGYVFKGWSKSLDGSNLILPGETVTVNAGESTTLYAIWKEETVTICLMDGDSEYLNLVVNKGSVPSLPVLSDRSESTFVGWYKDAELKEKWDTSSTVTKDIVLYAGWQPDFYFTTDPVADCKVTKTSYQTYIFDATVSKDFATSAKSVSWTVVKDGETVHESTGPYMTYQFLEDGEYDVTVKLVNSYGVESEHTEHVTIDTSERPGPTTGLIVMVLMAVVIVAVVARMLL